MTFVEDLRGRRHLLRRRGREWTQIDLRPRPIRAYRRLLRHNVRVRIMPAHWIGVATLGTARMEEKIVKVPKDEIVVAFGRPQPLVTGGDFEEDSAIHKKR